MVNHNEENALERRKLKEIVDRLDDRTWERDLGGGWTIGTMMCHLAFWDRMTIERLRIYVKKGSLVAPPDADNVEVINLSLRTVSAGIGREEGVKLALAAADEMDELVRTLTEAQLDELAKTGRDRWFKRSVHRHLHLPRIKAGLK